jgi:SAM-dependent methyltransferase
MPRFSEFDARGYRTVDVRTGYAGWVATYEDTVQDAMDIELLATLRTIPWASLGRAADLGCGTGRIGTWLRRQGVASVDGADVTPEMLEVAACKNVYCRLVVGDVAASGLEQAAYDLVTVCLVDEHLAELRPLYAEAWRLARRGGDFVLVGFHPHFIMTSGMPTHYTSDSGEPIAIQTHVHLLSEHIQAALAVGWSLREMNERVIDDDWVRLKPNWERYRGHPVAFAMTWRKEALGGA